MKTRMIFFCMCLLFLSCKAKQEEAEPKPIVEVKTAKAEIADLRLSAQAPATIFPREQANITARITARILRLTAKKGDSVAAGQILAQLEDRDLIAQREEAKAAIANAEANLQKIRAGTLPTEVERARGQVAMARATLNQAQKNYDRRKELFEKGGIPQREVLVSETELAQAKTAHEVAEKSLNLLQTQSGGQDIQIAQSSLDQAKARLAQAVAMFEFATVRSPFTGVITEQMMFPGDLAKPELPVFTVMDLSVAIARAQMPEAQGGGLRKGQTCGFTPADAHDVTFTGRISVINQAVDPQRRTFEIWCEIPNAQRRLKGGVFGSLNITTGAASQSVVVPVSAVQFAEDERKGTVMVVDDKHIAHTKEVETSEVIDGRVRILSGLSGGETVIIEGGYSLPDGTEVRIGKEKQQ